MKKTLLLVASLATTLFTTTQAQTFANASFETWHNYTVGSLALEAPVSWYGVDSLVTFIAPLAVIGGIHITPEKQLFKSTVAHSGSFSAEVKSAFIGTEVGNVPGIFSNAQIGIDIMGALGATPEDILNYVSYTGGTAITAQVDTVKAWILLDSLQMDQAVVNVSAVKTVQSSTNQDSVVLLGTGMQIIERGPNAFRQISIPVLYADAQVPEKLIVVFMSSNFAADTIHAGNDLKVDDVSYSYKAGTVSIQQPLLSENKVLVYPIPATHHIYFNLSAAVKATDFKLSIYDINGRLISQEQLKQAVNAKDVSGWAKGNYIYRLSNTQNDSVENGKFIVE
jgi:hypothetical protein